MALKFPDILEHNNSNLPLVDITELKGNSYPINTLAETGSIPSGKRKVGAIVFITSSQEFYGFYGQNTSSGDWNSTSNWRPLSTTTGSFSGSFVGTLTGTASYALNAATASYVPASAVAGLNLSNISTGSVTASVDIGENSFTLVSGSNTLFNISNTGVISGSTLYVTTISASNALVTNTVNAFNITAVSASFGYVQTTTGSAVIIGDEYIILNTQTPSSRFAGLQIYDSGSNATASIVWDSETNHFVYQNSSGSTYSGGGFLAGPRNTGSLSEVIYPTQYKVIRSQGDDHLYDSNIIDDDIAIRLGIKAEVTGGLYVSGGITGSLLGTASIASTASYINPLQQNVIITGSVNILDSAATLQIVGNGFGQSSIISPNGALVLTPGLYGVQINGANPDLTVNGNIMSTGANSYLTGSLLGTASYANNADLLDGINSDGFVKTSTNQTITGNKSFRDTTYFGQGEGYTDGKITFIEGNTGLSASIAIDTEANIVIQNAEDLTLMSFKQDGTGIELASGTFIGNLTGTADTASFVTSSNVYGPYGANSIITSSYAISASIAATASYVPASAVVGLNLTQIATGSISASVFINSPTAFSITSASVSLFSVDTSSLVTVKNLTISDNLIVNGTASFINSENLLIKDPFILINSGSTGLADSGIISQYNSAGSGSALYLKTSTVGDYGTYGRFATAFDVTSGEIQVTANEFVVTAKKASGVPPSSPTWGGSTNGFGNIYVNSDNGEVYIYA